MNRSHALPLRLTSLLVVVGLSTPWSATASLPYRSQATYGYAHDSGAVRTRVDKKDAQVLVDGSYAGIVDDFDGWFQKLYLPPGEHLIELRLEGYRTITERVSVSPRRTQEIRHRMVPLGEVDTRSEARSGSDDHDVSRPSGRYEPEEDEGEPPSERARPSTRAGSSRAPAPPTARSTAPDAPGQFGVLRLRVQPAEGEIRIDGEPWGTLEGIEEISIHLPAGIHRIELYRAGSAVFETNVEIRLGETTPLNVRFPR